MKIKEKLLFVFVPYLLVSIGFLIAWLIFYKWFIIEWNIVLVKEMVLGLIFPLILIWIMVHFLLRPRLKVFENNVSEGLYFIVIPLILIANFSMTSDFEESNYDLIKIQSIENVKNYSNEKYFQISDYQLDKQNKSYITRTFVNPDGEFIISVYTIMAFDKAENIWFGIKYSDVSKDKSDEINAEKVIEFLKQLNQDYENDLERVPTYFEQVRYSDHYDNFKTAINNVETTTNPIIINPKFEPYESRFGETKYIGLYMYGFLTLIYLVTIIFSKAHRYNYLRWRVEKRNKPFFKNTQHILNPFGNFGLFAVIGFISLLCFLIHTIFLGISIINPTEQEISSIGGFQYVDLSSGNYWHILAFPFVFFGMFHLLIDLTVLYISSFSGLFDKVKSSKLILTFFIGSLTGAWTTILLHKEMIVFGLFFGIVSVLGFHVIRKYLSEYRTWIYLIITVIYGGMHFYTEPTFIIGGIISFITGIILYFAFER